MFEVHCSLTPQVPFMFRPETGGEVEGRNWVRDLRDSVDRWGVLGCGVDGSQSGWLCVPCCAVPCRVRVLACMCVCVVGHGCVRAVRSRNNTRCFAVVVYSRTFALTVVRPHVRACVRAGVFYVRALRIVLGWQHAVYGETKGRSSCCLLYTSPSPRDRG